METVLWGSFIAAVICWPTLDLVWRLLAFSQRTRVGHFRQIS